MHSQGTRLLEENCEVIYADSLVEKNLISQISDMDAVIIRANGAVSRAIIQAAPRLKVIGRHGVGLDAIDLDAAKERGVRVVYTPMGNCESVAEHFVAFALMLAKKVRLADMALRAGNWKARYELIGTELRGKIVGIVGFGRIGQQTARICSNGFAMKVIYHGLRYQWHKVLDHMRHKIIHNLGHKLWHLFAHIIRHRNTISDAIQHRRHNLGHHHRQQEWEQNREHGLHKLQGSWYLTHEAHHGTHSERHSVY